MYANLKKKYGQNFLIDKNILSKITNLIPNKNLDILEIGPGDGKLTDKIIKYNPSKLTLVEIDKDLIRNLSIKYSSYKFINIINENILNLKTIDKFDLVISNTPYNVSSQIIVKLSLLSKPPSKLILMFQKEFAQRLLDKKINSINSLIKCFYNIKLNFHVGKNCFRPIPKVDSSVLTFSLKKELLIKKDEIEKFILFKRNLFSHKRKILRNLLKNYNLEKDFDLNLRVENLELATLIEIFRASNLKIY
mgnify:CR=1 FL=1|tara:strand:+ start:111 stop:857 length:747 start_codon:yes stop_codon:yes gene_type:complete